jgi:LPS export ABC transporter protein LptC
MEHRFWPRIRWIVSAAMVCLVVLFVVALKQRSVSTRQGPEAARSNSDEKAQLTINHMEYSDVRQGRTRYTVQADMARHYAEEQETILTNVNAVFYLDDGGKVTLEGDEGAIDHATKNMEIRGKVRVNYDGTYELTTARLFYDSDRHVIYTPDPVVIAGRGLTLRGVGATMDMEEQTMKVLSRVDTQLEGVRLGGWAGRG